MRAVDVAIVALFVAYALGSGLWHRRAASRGLEDYFLAGRTLTGWRAGASMTATQFAADTPLVVAGIVATQGLFPLWQFWSYGLAFLLLGFVFAPCWRRAGVLTDAELSELRYGGRAAAALRALRALLYGTLFNCAVLAMVLFASTLFAEEFLHWHAWLPPGLFEPLRVAVEAVGVPLTRSASGAAVWVVSTDNLISIGLVVALTLGYSTTGGLRSVVATDVAQLAIMFAATAGFTALAWRAAGGDLAGAIAAHFPGADAHPTALSPGRLLALGPEAAGASGGLVALFALQWLLQRNADGTGYLAQRSMACRDDTEARRAAVVFAFLQIVVRSALWVPLALALMLVVPFETGLGGDALVLERERSFVRAMSQLLPAGLLGLMLTAMLAALASTVDTHLNWGASYWANDLYRDGLARRWLGREPSSRELVWVARCANVLLIALALAIMSQLDSVRSAWKATLVLGAGMGPPMLLRWLWWRQSAAGELASLAVSALLAPIALWGLESEVARMALVAAASTAACVGTSLATGPEQARTLRAFYERARPAGAWGPVAAAAGRDAREPGLRLRSGLLHTLAAAASLYGLLLGALRALLHGPDVAAAAALAVAASAVPFWLPALRRTPVP